MKPVAVAQSVSVLPVPSAVTTSAALWVEKPVAVAHAESPCVSSDPSYVAAVPAMSGTTVLKPVAVAQSVRVLPVPNAVTTSAAEWVENPVAVAQSVKVLPVPKAVTTSAAE